MSPMVVPSQKSQPDLHESPIGLQIVVIVVPETTPQLVYM